MPENKIKQLEQIIGKTGKETKMFERRNKGMYLLECNVYESLVSHARTTILENVGLKWAPEASSLCCRALCAHNRQDEKGPLLFENNCMGITIGV